jgi:hypothetical protein
MPQGELTVVSIHDHELSEKRELDLKDILSALGERAARWNWCILYDFEALGSGENLDELTQAIWQARPGGMWLSGQEFVRFAHGIQQTIDGEFQAFPVGLEPQSIHVEELQARFPESRAELVIHIIDGCIFEVYAKQAEDIARLRARFADVHQEDSTHYF